MITHTTGLRKSILQAIKFGEFNVAKTLRFLIPVLDDFHRFKLWDG